MTDLKDLFEVAKSTIRQASFDGWIENDGPNCDIDGKANLLKESDALEAIETLEIRVFQFISSKPQNEVTKQ